jgi:plasmid stabilization system protein ParE
MAGVIITGPAKRDIQVAHDWWTENRSSEQAARWYVGIHASIQTLRNIPERCSKAAESDLLTQGVRQLLFGLGRQATHRILFAIDDGTVVVLRVRHTSQDTLSVDDLGR